MAAVPGAGKWRTNPAAGLRWRSFDGEWVVYDTGSGQTHLLDAFAAAVLGLVESAPQSEAELMSTLLEHLSAEERTSVPRALATILDQLKGVGLVEPIAA
jgi:PqqD family protein of HPr-rel-A system